MTVCGDLKFVFFADLPCLQQNLVLFGWDDLILHCLYWSESCPTEPFLILLRWPHPSFCSLSWSSPTRPLSMSFVVTSSFIVFIDLDRQPQKLVLILCRDLFIRCFCSLGSSHSDLIFVFNLFSSSVATFISALWWVFGTFLKIARKHSFAFWRTVSCIFQKNIPFRWWRMLKLFGRKSAMDRYYFFDFKIWGKSFLLACQDLEILLIAYLWRSERTFLCSCVDSKEHVLACRSRSGEIVVCVLAQRTKNQLTVFLVKVWRTAFAFSSVVVCEFVNHLIRFLEDSGTKIWTWSDPFLFLVDNSHFWRILEWIGRTSLHVIESQEKRLFLWSLQDLTNNCFHLCRHSVAFLWKRWATVLCVLTENARIFSRHLCE